MSRRPTRWQLGRYYVRRQLTLRAVLLDAVLYALGMWLAFRVLPEGWLPTTLFAVGAVVLLFILVVWAANDFKSLEVRTLFRRETWRPRIPPDWNESERERR